MQLSYQLLGIEQTNLLSVLFSAHHADEKPAMFERHYANSRLPVVDEAAERLVLNQGVTKSGDAYSIVILNAADAGAVHKLCEAEYSRASAAKKNYLAPRSRADIKSSMAFDHEKQEGMLVLGVVLNNGHLAAIGAVDLIDDEKDQGRGREYKGDGFETCAMHQQIYFKMAVAHPDKQSSGDNLLKLLYPYRVAVALCFPERKCFVTKTNNGIVKANYGQKLGWNKVDEYELEDAISPDDDMSDAQKAVVSAEKILDTYAIKRDNARAWLEQNHADIVQREPLYSVFVNHAANSVIAQPQPH